MVTRPPIGGFFEFQEPDGARDEDSVLGRWQRERPMAAFDNARSALTALVDELAPPRVWLPAYICASVIGDTWRARVRFYHQNDALDADIGQLDRDVLPHDLLVAVSYFGAPVAAALVDWARTKRDVRFLEDRAQSLDSGQADWADWILYSPRKLLGVADGGILVANGAGLLVPKPSDAPATVALWEAPLLRYEDPAGLDNDQWHQSHQKTERQLTVGRRRITMLSRWILSSTSMEPLVAARRRNWSILHADLSRWLAFDPGPASAPLGFVVDVPPERRQDVLRALHRDRIFAAVHWPDLASPAAQFGAEHERARQLITLPCDQRYDESSMRSVGRRVHAVLTQPSPMVRDL